VASIRPPAYLTLLKSLSLQIYSMSHEEFLTLHYICSNYILHPSQLSSEGFSSETPTIKLNFENAQVVVSGLFMKLLIENQSSSTPSFFILANCLEISARKVNTTTS